MEPLVGVVSFRLDLCRNPAEHHKNNKRRREEENEDCDGARREIEPVVGYMLRDAKQGYFLLSIPQCLMIQVGRAVNHQHIVRIHQYELVRWPARTDAPPDDGPPSLESVQGLVEVHRQGWEVVLPPNPASQSPSRRRRDAYSYLALAEVQQVEALDQLLVSQPNASSHWTTRRFSIRACIRVVTPVLTVDPRDPFALLELGSDDDSTRNHNLVAVAVLRHAALAVHEALRIGQRVLFHQVKRQKWSVPQVLVAEGDGKSSLDRVPSYVFVVDQATQVDWQDEPSEDAAEDNAMAERRLSRITGTISAIHKIKVGKEEYLHSLDLLPCGVSIGSQACVVFVTYFPMSTTLISALRPGATISAENLRDLGVVSVSGERCYGAGLRSQLSILACATDGSGKVCDKQMAIESNTLDTSTNHPCALLRIRRSYRECAVRRCVMLWLEDWHEGVPTDGVPGGPTPSPPSVADLMEAFLRVENLRIHRPQHSARNVYAEFFHSQDVLHGHPLDSGANQRVPMTLTQVHVAIHSLLPHCLRRLLQSNDCSFGVMASVHRFGFELVQTSDNLSAHESNLPAVFGLVRWEVNKSLGGQSHGVLSNGRFSFPITRLSPNVQSTTDISCFIVADVGSVVLSVLCLGRSEINPSQKSEALPLVASSLSSPGPLFTGSCCVVEQDDWVFLVTLRLVCPNIREITGSDLKPSPLTGSRSGDQKVATIQSILGGTLHQHPYSPDAVFVGLLGRVSMKPTKTLQNCFSGLKLTLSHVEHCQSRSLREFDISTIQSVELKLTTDIPEGLRLRLLQHVTQHQPTLRLTSQQLTMASVWWQVASDACSSPLLCGGWDELSTGASTCARTTGIQVFVPLSAVSPDPQRGYVRFSCRLEELTFSMVHLQPAERVAIGRPAPVPTMDLVASKRVLPGELRSIRAPRRLRSSDRNTQYAIGTLFHAVPTQAGIPTCSIADIFRLMCADLKDRSRCHLAPSLVRQIRKAQFLGASYCQITAECSTCYKTLEAFKQPSQNGRTAGAPPVSTGISYWDRPLPTASASHSSQIIPVRAVPPDASHLRCPNRCWTGAVSVKWECSGTLDDGTGQAKLYAERDAALLLLGVGVETVRRVEAGVLQHPRGTLVYSRGVPPRPELSAAVAAARKEAEIQRYQRGTRRQPAPETEEDVLGRLTPELRAEFELQRHCRASVEPYRPPHSASYCVRVKPLSDEVVRGGDLWNHPSEIDLIAVASSDGATGGQVSAAATTRRAATLTLPPLKLVLVDLAVCDDDN